MPGNWRARIRSEAAAGGSDALALIDASAIRAGRAAAKAKTQFFGLRIVLQHVRERAAAKHTSAHAAAKSAKPSGPDHPSAPAPSGCVDVAAVARAYADSRKAALAKRKGSVTS